MEPAIILWVENAIAVMERGYKNAPCVMVGVIVPVKAVMEEDLSNVYVATAQVINKYSVEILYGN